VCRKAHVPCDAQAARSAEQWPQRLEHRRRSEAPGEQHAVQRPVVGEWGPTLAQSEEDDIDARRRREVGALERMDDGRREPRLELIAQQGRPSQTQRRLALDHQVAVDRRVRS